MSTRRNWASGYLGKVVAALCSLMLAVAFFPAASISAWAEESAAATAAFSIKVYNEYTDKTEAVQSFTQDELNALAEQNTDELTYMYTGKSGDTTVTTKSYVTFAQLLDGVDSWVAGATLNPSDRNKGNPWTYEEITAELKCQDKAAPAVLALAAEKNGTAIESTDAPMTCMGTEDGSNAAGNCFWTGTSDFVVTTGFNIYAKSAINGATNLKKTYAKSALAKLAEKNTNELTYKFTGKSGDTTVTTKSYVTFAQLLEGVSEWTAGSTVNPSDRGKGDPWTYEFITAELKCQGASAPAVLALEAAKDEVAIDNAPMTCMGTEDGTNAAGNCFWTSTSDLVVTYLQPLDTATVTVAKAKAYTGKAQTPAVTAKLGDTALVEGTDYTLAYAKNTNAGTATATITGMGNCTGTATATFTIAKAANTLKVNAVKKVQNAKAKKKTSLKANKVFKVAKNVSKGALTYTKASGNKNISVAKNGKVTVKKGLKKGKSYTVKVKVASKATTNYKAANTTVSFKVKVK